MNSINQPTTSYHYIQDRILHSEQPKLQGVLAILSAIGLRKVVSCLSTQYHKTDMGVTKLPIGK